MQKDYMEPVLISVAEAQIASAERSLVAATGGENVCRLDKAGQATGGVKYHEGGVLALRAARRLIQSAEPGQARASMAELHERWRADLVAQRARERPSAPWIAYTQGGVDALERLLARFVEGRDG